ncbi:MAG: I78 family peptidase inhibitor [Pseudomonadota bacterium]
MISSGLPAARATAAHVRIPVPPGLLGTARAIPRILQFHATFLDFTRDTPLENPSGVGDVMKMSPKAFATIALLVLLPGCLSDTPQPSPDAASCGASDFQYLRGRSVDVLAAMTFLAPMRVIGPETVVTMDFLPNRLNVVHDADRIITRVYCG